MLSPNERSQRARIAALKRHHSTEPNVDQMQRDFKAARLESYIKSVVDAAPPLTPEQRDRLAVLLRGEAPA